jgi:hypothetical protein
VNIASTSEFSSSTPAEPKRRSLFRIVSGGNKNPDLYPPGQKALAGSPILTHPASSFSGKALHLHSPRSFRSSDPLFPCIFLREIHQEQVNGHRKPMRTLVAGFRRWPQNLDAS